MILNFVLLMVVIQTISLTVMAIMLFKLYISFDAISEFIFGFLSNVKVHDMSDAFVDDPFPDLDDELFGKGDIDDEDKGTKQ